MVAYSFQARFAAPIEADEKLQTVRAERKRHARAGEELQLYQGMRTRHCRLLGRRRCVSVHPIALGLGSDLILVGEDYPLPAIDTGGAIYSHPATGDARLKAVDLDDFARRDGFAGWRSMKVFWAEAHDAWAELSEQARATALWIGVVICWAPGAACDTTFHHPIGLDAELEAMGVR